MMNGNPPFAGGGDTHSNSAAVLESALDALRGEQNDLSPSHLTNFLVSLLSDNAPDSSLLYQKDRRTLVRAVVDRIGPDAFTQVLHHALPNIR